MERKYVKVRRPYVYADSYLCAFMGNLNIEKTQKVYNMQNCVKYLKYEL